MWWGASLESSIQFPAFYIGGGLMFQGTRGNGMGGLGVKKIANTRESVKGQKYPGLSVCGLLCPVVPCASLTQNKKRTKARGHQSTFVLPGSKRPEMVALRSCTVCDSTTKQAQKCCSSAASAAERPTSRGRGAGVRVCVSNSAKRIRKKAGVGGIRPHAASVVGGCLCSTLTAALWKTRFGVCPGREGKESGVACLSRRRAAVGTPSQERCDRRHAVQFLRRLADPLNNTLLAGHIAKEAAPMRGVCSCNLTCKLIKIVREAPFGKAPVQGLEVRAPLAGLRFVFHHNPRGRASREAARARWGVLCAVSPAPCCGVLWLSLWRTRRFARSAAGNNDSRRVDNVDEAGSQSVAHAVCRRRSARRTALAAILTDVVGRSCTAHRGENLLAAMWGLFWSDDCARPPGCCLLLQLVGYDGHNGLGTHVM